MKIIEAMKKLRLIEKKMDNNCESIEKYSSQLSNERPYFGTEEKQKNQVKNLIQANLDYLKNYLYLKQAVEKTNLETKVKICDSQEYTLSELLILKRKLCKQMITTFRSLSSNSADKRHSGIIGQEMKDAEGKPLFTVRFYDEKFKNEKLNYWQELMVTIDGTLEVKNAVTDLIE